MMVRRHWPLATDNMLPMLNFGQIRAYSISTYSEGAENIIFAIQY